MQDHQLFHEMGRDRHQRFMEEASQRPTRRKPLFLLLVAQVARLLTLLYH